MLQSLFFSVLKKEKEKLFSFFEATFFISLMASSANFFVAVFPLPNVTHALDRFPILPSLLQTSKFLLRCLQKNSCNSVKNRKNRCYYTVWKFDDFSITQILREINFWDSRSAKYAIFNLFRGSEL